MEEEYLAQSEDENASVSTSATDTEEEEDESETFDLGAENEIEIDDDEISESQLGGEGYETPVKTTNKLPVQPAIVSQFSSPTINGESESDEEDDEEDEDESYLKKFDKDIKHNYIVDFHPEYVTTNFHEVQKLSTVVRDKRGIIIDEFHKTVPLLTKYEKTRVLGIRAKQINDGAKPYHRVPEYLIDGYAIAQIELENKKLPFIIKRPLPNGGCEFWKLSDLQLI